MQPQPIIDRLRRGGFDVDYHIVEISELTPEILAAKGWDIAIALYPLEDIDTAELIRRLTALTPLVLISENVEIAMASELVKIGAADVIRKSEIERLPLIAAREMKVARERRKMRLVEDELRDSEREKSLILNSVSELVVFHDHNRRVLWTNRAAADSVGQSLQAILGRHCYEIWHGRESACPHCPVSLAFKTGEYAEAEITTPDGRIWIIKAYPAKDETGKVVGAVEVAAEITEQKKTREALIESEERYQTLFDQAPDGIIVADSKTTRFIMANKAALQLFGYTREQLLGLGVRDIHPEDFLEAAFKEFQEVTQGAKWLIHEMPCVRRDGSKFFADIYAFGAKIDKRASTIGFFRDVTERKLAEEALKESANRLTMALEASNDGIWDWYLDPEKVYFSPRWYTMLGYEPDEMPASYATWKSLLHPDDVEYAEEEIRQHIELRKPYYVEFRMRAKDGKYRWMLSKGSVVESDPAGKPIRLSGIHVDITERKKAEEKLRLNEARLQALLRLSQMTGSTLQEITEFALEEGVNLTSSKTGYLAFTNEDETVLNMYAWSKSAREDCNIPDKPLIYEVAKTGLWGEVIRQRKPVITNNYSAPNPLKKGMPQGHVPIYRHMNIPVFDGDRIVAVAGVGNKEDEYDETDVAQLTLLMDGMWRLLQRKKQEAALKESEARYRNLFERSPDIVMVLKDEAFVATNAAIERVLGYQPEEIIGKHPWDISPELQPDAGKSIHAAKKYIEKANKEGPQTFEWVHLRKDSASVDCEVTLITYPQEGETYVQAIVRDVTERKRAEEMRLHYEREAESQKRQFYRDTIISVTGGKLDICEHITVEPYLRDAEIKTEVLQPFDVSVARRQVEDFCQRKGLEGERLHTFILGVGEAITNAVKHAHSGCVYVGANEEDVWVAVEDKGSGIESLLLPKAVLFKGFSTKPSLGLGYSLMLEVADQILLNTGQQGTTVVLVKSIVEKEMLFTTEQIPDTWEGIPNIST